MIARESVAASQRFTPANPCPVCTGHERLPRGDARRCHGFLSADGAWAHYSREEHAGSLPIELDSATYAHRLSGECKCGRRHDPRSEPLPNGRYERAPIVKLYQYPDAAGALRYQVVRRADKTFSQRRPDGHGGWLYNLDGVRRVLYRLPELHAADPALPVFYAEGEKDADALGALGLVATTNSEGAGKLRSEAAEALRGRHVVILPDNDEPGRAGAEKNARTLHGVAASIRILALPGLPADGGDVCYWLAAGGTADELRRLAAAAPLWEPRTEQGPANRPNRETPTFALTKLTDLLAEPPEAIDWVVDGLLIAGGISMVAAKPKAGKSTLARNAALCVARGAPFLGRATAPGPVIYLALEEKRAKVAEHFAGMGATTEPIVVHVGAAPEEALDALTAAVVEYGAVLAIVDPLFKLVRLRDGNDYAEGSRKLEPLIELARATGCHILCAHHLGKADRESGDGVLGTTALFGAVDTLVLLRRGREGQRTIESIQRYGEDLPATVVDLDPATGVVSAAGDVATIRLREACAAVLEALGDETLPERDIRERVGGNESLTAKAVRAMVEDERLIRTGEGKRNAPYLYSVSRFLGSHLIANRETEKRDDWGEV